MYDWSSSMAALLRCEEYSPHTRHSVLRCATHSISGLYIHRRGSSRLEFLPRALGLADLSRCAGDRPGGRDFRPELSSSIRSGLSSGMSDVDMRCDDGCG